MFKLNFNIKDMETAILFARILEIENTGITFITGENTVAIWKMHKRLEIKKTRTSASKNVIPIYDNFISLKQAAKVVFEYRSEIKNTGKIILSEH